MSRTVDYRLTEWLVDSKIEHKAEFIQMYYDKGPLGFYVYVLMRNIICCQNGYYAILNDSLLNYIHFKLGKWTRPVNYINELIAYFGDIDILDKTLLKKNILTSADIQKDWFKAKKTARAKIDFENLEYWLLGDK